MISNKVDTNSYKTSATQAMGFFVIEEVYSFLRRFQCSILFLQFRIKYYIALPPGTINIPGGMPLNWYSCIYSCGHAPLPDNIRKIVPVKLSS